MEEYRVDFAKIFSPIGVTYIRREPGSDELSCSKTYTSMNGEVTRTTCLILEAREQAELPRPQASFAEKVTRELPRKLRDILATWAINWTLRTSLIWKYLWGTDGVYVVFARRPAFFRAVQDDVWPFGTTGTALSGGRLMDQRAQGLSVPTLWAMVSGEEEAGVVMSYTGTPIPSLERASAEQRQELVRTLASLHDLGIHHHDVRANNVLVNGKGALTLIDFDQAEFIDGPCMGCPDADVLSLLRERSDAPAI
ncbi:hypothetical protein B0H10DRAFT_241450 [Mycena sp. CBHHK59/15]|nr:hypothetical protein B0H10DRAFT_241450 [Mycena sp. CBHHK59/15]